MAVEFDYLDLEGEVNPIWPTGGSRDWSRAGHAKRRLGPFGIAGLAVLILLISQIAINLLRAPSGEMEVHTPFQPNFNLRDQRPPLLFSVPLESPIFPYESYALTQGPHGASYGHMAIDLASGEGSKIKSPISGVISALFRDGLGNSTLVIDNARYQVTLMHGKYSVFIGQQVDQGQNVGSESNMGYTIDMNGQICTDRDCGHHTHLNIFDKQIGANVNPLEILK